MKPDASIGSDQPDAQIPWTRLATWFVASRIFIWGIAGISLRFVPPGPYFRLPQSALDWLKHWDAPWFLNVIQNGYTYDPTKMSSVNFLPLYPLLVRAVAWVVPNVELAAYLVSNALCFGAAVLLWCLTRDITRHVGAAWIAVLFFWFGPVSFFFSTIYAEATFVFFALATLVTARRERWWLAGGLGAIAALSRSIGLFLIIPLAIEFIARHPNLAAWRDRSTWRKLPGVFLPAAGTAAYVAFLAWRFDEPRAYLVSQRFGGHTFSYPWDLLRSYHFVSLTPEYQAWFAATVFIGLLLLAAGVLVRLPWSLLAFAGAFCMLHFCVKTVEGLPRFLSAVFPFYCTLGILGARWPAVARVLLPLSAAMLAVTTALFVNGYWFT